jgi:hypothetical protein
MKPLTRLVLTVILMPPVVTAVMCGLSFGADYLLGYDRTYEQVETAGLFLLVCWYVLAVGWARQAWRTLKQAGAHCETIARPAQTRPEAAGDN